MRLRNLQRIGRALGPDKYLCDAPAAMARLMKELERLHGWTQRVEKRLSAVERASKNQDAIIDVFVRKFRLVALQFKMLEIWIKEVERAK